MNPSILPDVPKDTWSPFPPVNNPMTKIGIVSKLDHCKAHKAALESLGFEVILLGPSPTSFPDSLRVVVVRILSISHGGDKCARIWGREPGRVLIYENGLTGLLRSMEMVGLLKKDAREAEMCHIPNPVPFSDSGIEISQPKNMSVSKFSAYYLKVLGHFQGIPEEVVSRARSITDVEDFRKFSPLLPEFCELTRPYFRYSGDPTSAFIFFYMLSSPGFSPQVRDVLSYYHIMSGKESNSGFVKVAAWYMGFPAPTAVKTTPAPSSPISPAHTESCQVSPSTEVPTLNIPDPQAQSPEVAEKEPTPTLSPFEIDVRRVLDSNTDSVLGLMLEVENLRKSVESLTGTLRVLLDSKPDHSMVQTPVLFPDLADMKRKLAEAGFRGQLVFSIE